MRADVYLLVRCAIPERLEEELPVILESLPVLGSHLEPAEDGLSRLDVYLEHGLRREAEALSRCLRILGGSQTSINEVAGEDWLASYRNHVRPFAVGTRWWMDPHPENPTSAPQGRMRLAIEPRMAFGTGSHESTQLVLLELEELEIDGRTVLDVGTGSGVLALAADALGASWVVGFDVDLQAVLVARQIRGQQDWSAAPRYVAGPLRCLARRGYDLVLCNMIPEHFEPLLDDLVPMLGEDGFAIFSGILLSQQAAVSQLLVRAGLLVVAERRLGEWTALRTRRG